MTREELQHEVRYLAKVMRIAQETKERIDAAWDEVKAKFEAEHEKDIKLLAELNKELEEKRELIEEHAVQLAEETGEKTPVPGVTVREVTNLSYRNADAIKWALDQAQLNGLNPSEYLAPRKRPLEKALRAMKPAFVEFVTVRQVAFARDLPQLYDTPITDSP